MCVKYALHGSPFEGGDTEYIPRVEQAVASELRGCEPARGEHTPDTSAKIIQTFQVSRRGSSQYHKILTPSQAVRQWTQTNTSSHHDYRFGLTFIIQGARVE